MKNYTLYLDESETHEHDKIKNIDINYHFCLAGIIIADDDFDIINNNLNNFKKKIWKEECNPEKIILHQMRITDAEKGRINIKLYPEYKKFNKNSNRKNFYDEFKKFISKNNITIVGGSVCLKSLDDYFNINKTNKPDKYLICLQLLLENYCHFLCKNNALGKIIYESRETIADEQLRNRFYHIKLMGSMYINKETTEKHLLGIDFLPKSNNNAGLQIADFVPNVFAKDHAKFDQSKYNIFNALKYCRYDGQIANKDRFGIKYMP